MAGFPNPNASGEYCTTRSYGTQCSLSPFLMVLRSDEWMRDLEIRRQINSSGFPLTPPELKQPTYYTSYDHVIKDPKTDLISTHLPTYTLIPSISQDKMPLIAATGAKPRVILGLMTFGPDESAGARITDIGETNRIVDRFQERGYNEVDTARVYIKGQQEAFTRETRWKDRGLTLATKVKYPAEAGGNAAPKVVESVETSLKELGTDVIDVSFYSFFSTHCLS